MLRVQPFKGSQTFYLFWNFHPVWINLEDCGTLPRLLADWRSGRFLIRNGGVSLKKYPEN